MIEVKDYVIIIGSSNMDLNIYSERLPKPGETVTGGTFKQYLGGKGANQSVASVRSGSDTFFIAKIGRDAFGDQILLQLRNEGINIDHIIRDPNELSGIAFIMIDKIGENMISVAPGANIKLKPEDIRKNADLIKNANSLVVQMEIPIETIDEIFSIASKGNVIKILNPAPLKSIPVKILKNVDVSPSTLSYHLKKMIDYEIINVNTYGKNRGYSITNKEKIISLLIQYKPYNLIDSFKDVWIDLSV